MAAHMKSGEKLIHFFSFQLARSADKEIRWMFGAAGVFVTLFAKGSFFFLFFFL